MLHRITKNLRYIVLGIFLLVIALTTVFVFDNFNKTLEQAEQVLVLKQQVAPAVLNERMFENVMSALEAKTSTSPIGTIRDPF